MQRRIACVGVHVRACVPIAIAIFSSLLVASCGSFEFLNFGNAQPQAAALPAAPQPDVRQAAETATDTTFWPTHGWRVSSPEAQGIDSTVLANALDEIRARHIPVNSLLIERHGAIVADVYFYPYTDERTHDVASVTKSVTSTLVGIAMGEHRLASLDASVESLLPDQRIQGDDAKKAHITLANLLSMTSGLDCSDAGGRNFLQQMESSRHWTTFVLNRRETSDPGSTFDYCAGNMHLVSAVLTRATGESASDFAREKLFEPLGITDVSWPKDSDGVSHGFADLKLEPRDMAKLGYLWLHHGQWDGKQIVPTEYLADAFSRHADVEPNVEYGYGMWIYPEHGHAGGPADFEANGAGGQRITVIPSQDVVEVITGSGLDANEVSSLLADAVKSDGALPENASAAEKLAVRIAEAEAGTTFELAGVVPMPRPAPEDSAASVATATPPPPMVVPQPRPEYSTQGVSPAMAATAVAADLPRPKPNS